MGRYLFASYGDIFSKRNLVVYLGHWTQRISADLTSIEISVFYLQDVALLQTLSLSSSRRFEQKFFLSSWKHGTCKIRWRNIAPSYMTIRILQSRPHLLYWFEQNSRGGYWFESLEITLHLCRFMVEALRFWTRQAHVFLILYLP